MNTPDNIVETSETNVVVETDGSETVETVTETIPEEESDDILEDGQRDDTDDELPLDIGNIPISSTSVLEALAELSEEDEDVALKQTVPTYGIQDILDQIGQHVVDLGRDYLKSEGETVPEDTITKKILDAGMKLFYAKVRTEDGYDRGLAQAVYSASNEAPRIADALRYAKTPETFQNVYREGEYRLGIRTPTIGKGNTSKVVSGDAGVIAFTLHRNKGLIRRFPLYNSGFYVDIMTPTNLELAEFHKKVYSKEVSYGRRLGGLYYFYADYMIKFEAISLLLSCIVDSNLKGWEDADYLVQKIRLPDYKTLLMAIAYLMYPNGYDDFVYVCTKCKKTINLKVDLKKMIRTDFSRLPQACKQIMNDPEMPITEDVYKAYHDALGMDAASFSYDNCTIKLQTPTLQSYMTYGNQYNTEILNKVDATNLKTINEMLLYRHYRAYAPWISAIVSEPDPDDPDEAMSIVGNTGIAKILDTFQSQDMDGTIITQLEDYINRSELTLICHRKMECCKPPSEATDGRIDASQLYVPVDPFLTFFTLSDERSRS